MYNVLVGNPDQNSAILRHVQKEVYPNFKIEREGWKPLKGPGVIFCERGYEHSDPLD